VTATRIDFRSTRWTADGTTTPSSTGLRLPARWSPRPVRVLADRFLRSHLAADLRDWAWLVCVLTAAVVVLAAIDPLIFGGTP
jgi:hypothetical protein